MAIYNNENANFNNDLFVNDYEIKINELESTLVNANEKMAHLEDKYLRLAAEYDNYRKRSLKEKEELRENAHARTTETFLQVIDDFERALNNIQDNEAKQGVKLIYDKFLSILSFNGVEPIKIKIKETKFDDDYHEAVMMVNGVKKGVIADVVQTGYILNKDKVLRHAKVIVGN